MHGIDPSLCASLLRGFTDQLLSAQKPTPAGSSLNETMSSIRAVSDAASRAMRSSLATFYPEIGWQKEEVDSQELSSSGAHWIYDAVDGAYHYLQQLPLWSASLALVVGGQTVFSLVYDPVLQELFCASLRQGATLNDEPVQVSSKGLLETAVLGTAVPPRRAASVEEHTQSLAQLAAVANEVFVIRPMASASLQLAYVAAGRLDGYWEVGHDVNDWLAGALLVREAGGVVTSFDSDRIGLEVDGIVAAPKALHSPIRRLVCRN